LTLRPSLDLALIGNSSIAALLDRRGSIVWMCWPRIDGDPVFCSLLDGDASKGGFFSIELAEESEAGTEQSYVRNTAMVRTEVRAASGASFAITDFAPRFRHHGRMFKPPMIVRWIEPIEGLCRIRISCRPRLGYGEKIAARFSGSNHVRYDLEHSAIRLTSDAPATYIVSESGFVLSRPVTLILHSDETLADSVGHVGQNFRAQTIFHWQEWVRTLNVPLEWQEQVIRAAITLQLCSFEDTGAIVAALTTSIPEAPGSSRNWDYRYCWIRDAFHTVQALNRVGATATMERFIDYVTNVIAYERGPTLKPVYSIVPESPLEEVEAPFLSGFGGAGPVRVGNAARDQIQHDVFGSVILAASQMFYDERLPSKGDKSLFLSLEPLGMSALSNALTPDAGIWEYRGRLRVHTHSAAMCWVACDRLSRIAAKLELSDRALQWRQSADELKQTILSRAWNENLKCFAGSLDGEELDASVLLLHEIGIVPAHDERFISTVDTIGRLLQRNGHVRRYSAPDDFGVPSVAFIACTFWHVDALAAIGRVEEARTIFEDLLSHMNHVGLLSEDLDPMTGVLWGNFPQTYSMAGLIVAATRLSKQWGSVE
jgi:GH15 family glucan-1,4-alpha-glucosidase